MTFFRLLIVPGLCALVAGGHAAVPRTALPRIDDYTLMWWAEGFPSHTPTAPWLRCMQTGTYALALNTETMRVPHFGAVAGGRGYAAAAQGDDRSWQVLPAAELALDLIVDGKAYRCTAGGKWSRFAGPRVIESGRYFQRADVTDLVFTAADGARLNVEARFETAAWPDRLGLILAARPGLQPIPSGEDCFGRLGGGFGLDGTNHFEVGHRAEWDPEQFTLELWTYVPLDYKNSDRAAPWLVCKNRNEVTEGNFGLVITNGKPQARLNIGGGRDHAVVVEASTRQPLKFEAWNHLALSYDGDSLRLFVNGAPAGEKSIRLKRVPGGDALAFGRREDNAGDGYHFRGAIDEIRLYDRALTAEELRRHWSQPEAADRGPKPVGEWGFSARGQAAMARRSAEWKEAAMEITFATAQGRRQQRWSLPREETWRAPVWHEVSLALDPVPFTLAETRSLIDLQASEAASGAACPVAYDAGPGWHRVNLDGVEPIVPTGGGARQNDAIERVKLVLTNPTDREQPARLMFEKTSVGFRHRFGAAITGISAVLRDAAGFPTGIPVQLSKNWHQHPEAGGYAGAWFHGLAQLHLPPAASIELELTLAYGHWGGVAAASHAQLCLIGWGSNQLWEQSALGAWGESICYEPDQVQANSTITDVRPLMVTSMGNGAPWSWTSNVGGGDFFRLFDLGGNRVAHTAMRTAFHRQGPCLTEVTHAGRLGPGITHSTTVSLARSDDVVRGIYRLRMDVQTAADFSRFVIFQIGADTYSSTGERKMALGDESGLRRQWDTQWGGNTYRTAALEATGRLPWVSLHEAVPRANERPGAWANRGFVIREWKARLGGVEASPWIAERGLNLRSITSSTIDVLPPPGVTRLLPGDFVEATIEHVIVPQWARDYYGPNQALRAALAKDENTWRLIHREAVGNDPKAVVQRGVLQRTQPAVTIGAVDDEAAFTLTGGLGYVPVTFTGLSSPRGFTVTVDGRPLDQSVHGRDFWQTDYDATTRTWSLTYNLLTDDTVSHRVTLASAR